MRCWDLASALSITLVDLTVTLQPLTTCCKTQQHWSLQNGYYLHYARSVTTLLLPHAQHGMALNQYTISLQTTPGYVMEYPLITICQNNTISALKFQSNLDITYNTWSMSIYKWTWLCISHCSMTITWCLQPVLIVREPTNMTWSCNLRLGNQLQ